MRAHTRSVGTFRCARRRTHGGGLCDHRARCQSARGRISQPPALAASSRQEARADDSEIVEQNGSERPPSVRQIEILDDGTVVTVEFDPRGEVARRSYFWTPDGELLSQILSAALRRPGTDLNKT